MNSDIVAQVEGLGKSFKIYSGSLDIINEWVTLGKRSFHKNYQALKDVSFTIHKGEFVGIIGQNGAGKSTLLRVITGVLEPTSGSYKINGRVLSILELSGGTDKDLTGRENVIRSGQLLGLPDGYVQERMDAIKEFSELDDYFDQPLRMYSTGMRTRLSFSMFAFLDTDLLILDEVLAVGDIFFKQKCFIRLAELIEKKTSIVLVTHSMAIIQRYCNRVIVLDKGEKIYDGDPVGGIHLYIQLHGEKRAKSIEALGLDEEDVMGLEAPSDNNAIQKSSSLKIVQLDSWPQDNVFNFKSFPKLRGKGKATLTRMAVLNDKGEPALVFKQGESMHVYCEVHLKKDIGMPIFNLEIRDQYNLLIHSKTSFQNRAEVPPVISRDTIIHYHQSIVLNIAPQNYIITLDCFNTLEGDEHSQLERIDLGGITKNVVRLFRLEQAYAIAILPQYDERMSLVHGGLCDLPGESHFQVTQQQPSIISNHPRNTT